MKFRKQITDLLGLIAAIAVLIQGTPSKAFELPATGLLGHFTSDAGTIGTEDFTKDSYTETNLPDEQGMNDPNGMVIDKINKRIWVTDTLKNRVLGFELNDDYALSDGTADFVLGQADFTGVSANRSDAINSAGLSAPWGLAFDADNERLFVSDAGNNRVLIYSAGSTVTKEAIGVIGQEDFLTGAVAGTTAADTLNAPKGLAYDPVNDRLIVVDSGNNRVLAFNGASAADPAVAGRNADIVLGQPDFATRTTGLTASTMNTPMSVAWDSVNERLFVSDKDNDRVLVFDGTAITGAAPVAAANVLGQTTMTEHLVSRTKSRVHDPVGLAYDSNNNRLFVSEYYDGYNRVMLYDVTDITDGEDATGLIGKKQFIDADSAGVTSKNFLYETGLLYDEDLRQLFVADTYRDRVMIFQMPYMNTANMPAAVVGQTYDNDLTASGGTTPYTFTALSDMTSLNSAGISWSTNAGWLYGFPNKTGSYPVSIKLTDNSVGTDQLGFTDIANFTINITATSTPIGIPTNLSAAAASSSQVNLTWNAPSDIGSGIKGYKVYRNNALIKIIDENTASFSDTGLTAETQYSYKVAAYDTNGVVSSQTAAVTVTTLAAGQIADTERPIAPTITGTAISSSQINLSWSGATDNVGVTGYQIYRDGSMINTATGTTYSDTGLQANTTYSYMVFSKDAANNVSLAPTPVSIKTPVAAPGETPTTPSTTSNGSDDHKKKEEAPKRVIKNSTRYVSRGSVMVQSGKAFSKNATISLYYTNKNGVYTTKPVILKTNSKGAFSTAFKVTKPAGTYKWYVVDGRSGRKSKVKTYIVL